MYFKLPIGFSFKSADTSKQIIDGQVIKWLSTWKTQRLYKTAYGVDWQSFDYTKHKDRDDLNSNLKTFLSQQLSDGLPQVTAKTVTVDMKQMDGGNFVFNLVYIYKQLFQSSIDVNVNMSGQVDVQLNVGSIG